MKSRQAKLLNILVQGTIKQKEDTPRDSNTVIQGNLFHHQLPQKVPLSSFNLNKSYEVVGVKELKSYCQRMRSSKNLSKRFTSSKGMLAFSLMQKSKEEQFISQSQLLKMKDSQEDSHQQKSFPWQGNGFLKHSSSLHTTLFSSNTTKYEFSLNKVKKNHRNYLQNWTKTETDAQKVKGFPSVLRLATKQRQRSEQKQTLELKNLKQNFTYSNWQQNLRREDKLKEYYKGRQDKKLKIRSNLLTLLGKKKMEQEKQWVNEKGKEGFKFKFIKENKETI